MKKYLSFASNCLLIILLLSCNGSSSTTPTSTSGKLDTTFNSGGTLPGTVTTSFGTGIYDYGNALAIDSSGKIVVAGKSYNAGIVYFALARYNTDGTLDTSFGSGGIVTTSFGDGSDDEANAVAIDGSGNIVVAGFSYDSSSSSYLFAVARYTTEGVLDTTFNSNGLVTTAIGAGGNDRAYGIAIDGNGNIVAAGFSYDSSGNYLFAVARYTASGVNAVPRYYL